MVVPISLWLHIAAVVTAIGGSAFVLFVLRPALLATLGPEDRERVMEQVRARFHPILWVSIGVIAVTGLAAAGSLQVLRPEVLFGTTYGQMLTIKVLLALVLFASALLITLPLPALARFRERTPQYLRMNVSIAVLIILIAVMLRRIPT